MNSTSSSSSSASSGGSSFTVSRRASVVAAADVANVADVEHGQHQQLYQHHQYQHQHLHHYQQHNQHNQHSQKEYDDHQKKVRASSTRQQQQQLAIALLLTLFLLGMVKMFRLFPPISSTASSSIASSISLPYTLASNGPHATSLAIGVISGPQIVQQRRVRLLQETWFTSLDPQRDGVLVFSDGADATVPAVGIPGTGSTWQGAQDRWLPAVTYLSMAFPKAEWYVLVDDDTFLIPRNLKAMLSEERMKNKNEGEEEEIYIGRTMFVTPQEGKLQGQMLPFAHGGSGVVLSAALVRKIVPLIMEVLVGERERCQGTGYGDGDLGLCIKVLRDVSVRHDACLHSLGPKGSYEGEGGEEEEVGWFGDGGRPCSFHYAFGEDRERGEGGKEGGREEGRIEGGKDGAGDEQIRTWHRRYNVEE